MALVNSRWLQVRSVHAASLRPALAWLALCVLGYLPKLANAQDRWTTQFFYDKADSVLNIQDMACPSAQRCVAAGVITDKRDHEKGVTVVTSDGGQHWELNDIAERPVSLFFLNDSTGWMVTEHGIWTTSESGRVWKKAEALKGITQVHFLDDSHGFAIGYPKAIYETTDGGKKWVKVAAAAQPPGKPDETIYDCMAFAGQQGVIFGHALEDNAASPLWANPSRAQSRREHERPTFLLETFDGGKNWSVSTSSILGNITRLRFSKQDFVVALVEYHDFYSLPSTVSKVKLGGRGSQVIFGEPDRAVTDVALIGDGGLIAAIEPPGKSNQVPIPGKLKMLKSSNLKVWEEMDVDYRAVAQRAVLAAADAQHAWVATDTGMILALAHDTAARTALEEKHTAAAPFYPHLLHNGAIPTP